MNMDEIRIHFHWIRILRLEKKTESLTVQDHGAGQRDPPGPAGAPAARRFLQSDQQTF